MSDAATGLKPFVTRLHFYIGLFVGPFILIAAVTGLLYVLTPQLEDWIYRDQLRTASEGPAVSLSAQAAAARAFIGDAPTLFAVRPAIGPGYTTRIMFSEPGHGGSESRAIFVDPATLEIRGDLIVYGTSGTLPFRTAIDYLHRNLMLGEPGRIYSELAASWLWIVALGGAAMWWWRRNPRRSSADLNANLRARRFHGQVGIWIVVGLVFVSATGLTWSERAGGRISELRNAVGWVTPSVSTLLADENPAADGHHAHHAPVLFDGPQNTDHALQLDRVEAASRQAGLASPMIEIQVPRAEDRGWMVREYDRSWPSDVDAVAIDPRTMEVIDSAFFETFPVVAKLIRWGIDLHMGVLFGIANQILMAAIAIGLIVSIIYGYRIWWLRRPSPGSAPRTLVQSWSHLSSPLKMATIAIAAFFGWALPLVGASLTAFLLVDIARWRFAATRPKTA